jgi:hypothetical protein
MHCSLLSLGCVFGFAASEEQASLTALRALKIAQRRLRPEVRAKLLSVTSARTNGNLKPEAWRFVFLDQETSGHCRVVTVAAKASSEHPGTVEAFSSSKMESADSLHAIPQNKLILDSDRVLEQARAASKLKGIKAVEYRLLQARSGREPMWHLHFYAETGEAVASFQVGAKTGSTSLVGTEAAA